MGRKPITVYKVVKRVGNKRISARVPTWYEELVPKFLRTYIYGNNKKATVETSIAFKTLAQSKIFRLPGEEIWEAEADNANPISRICTLQQLVAGIDITQVNKNLLPNGEITLSGAIAPEGSLLCTNLKLTRKIM